MTPSLLAPPKDTEVLSSYTQEDTTQSQVPQGEYHQFEQTVPTPLSLSDSASSLSRDDT